MSGIWIIRKLDGDDVLEEWSVTGALTEPEIHKMLQRLVSQNLDDDEIIASSLRKNNPKYRPLLERVGRGSPINYGAGINYTAHFEDG